MIEEILPSGVCVAEAFGDDDAEGQLFVEEEALISRSTDKRRAEFTTVRSCARRALRDLGQPPAPILRGTAGAPVWPAGVVGSMTHCAGYRAAVVAAGEQALSIGIDAEPARPLPDGVLSLVAVPGDRAALADLTDLDPTTHWDRLLFCAKEAAYKAWYPLVGRWLGFSDATVMIDQDGMFVTHVQAAGPHEPATFTGRWMSRAGLLLAAVAVMP